MLDEVTLKVAAHAAELSGPVLLFLYADKNGNGLRDGEEPAQFRIITNAPDTGEFEISPVRECPYWGWNALQRAQAEDQGPHVSFEAPSSSDATEKGSKIGEVDGGYAARAYSPGPLLVQTNGVVGLPAPGANTLTNLVAGTDYWVKAFRDLNSNGVWEGKEPPCFRITKVFLTAAGATNINVHVEKTRGMRVDFSFESGTTTQIAQRIVSNAVAGAKPLPDSDSLASDVDPNLQLR